MRIYLKKGRVFDQNEKKRDELSTHLASFITGGVDPKAKAAWDFLLSDYPSLQALPFTGCRKGLWIILLLTKQKAFCQEKGGTF